MSTHTLDETTRGRALIVSVLGALTLLALAATVFAVASQARSVSHQAEQSVRIIEDLRVVSIARAELSIASRISAVSPDQKEILESSIDNATNALGAVEANTDDETPSEIIAALAFYREAADAQGMLILDGEADADEALTAEVRTGAAFDELSGVMRTEQVAALERLRADNDLMNVIGTVATFFVAFVVPSAALYIFEALRRTPRRARALELDFENATATSQAMAAAVAKEAARLRTSLVTLPPGAHSDDLRRSVLRFEHVAALNGAVRTMHNVDLSVNSLAAEVVDGVDGDIGLHVQENSAPVVHGDRDQITLVLYELLHNAVVHGSAPVRLDVFTHGDVVSMTVSDHGRGLPDIVEDAIIHDNEYATRGNLLSGAYGFGLLAAREATESLGGQLRYHRSDVETSLIVELPVGHSAPVAKPAMSAQSERLDGLAAA